MCCFDSSTISRTQRRFARGGWLRRTRAPAHPVARGKFPLIAFSVGQGVIRASDTSITEELASHGYIVALVESPLQGEMVLPSGREISDSAGRFGDPASHVRGVASWSRDISWVLDRLARNAPPSVTQVAHAIDWRRIGAAGHSSGGLVAAQTCESDHRVRACVNLDGGVGGPNREPMAEFVSHGVTTPILFARSQPLYNDTTLTRRGMTREQWVQRGAGGRMAYDSLAARSRDSLTVAFVAGTGHFSFSDAPFVMSNAITRFGGRIIAPYRGWEIITSTLIAYFDEHLNGARGALAAAAARFPEPTLERRH